MENKSITIIIDIGNPKGSEFKKVCYLLMYLKYTTAISRICFELNYPNYKHIEERNEWYALKFRDIRDDILSIVDDTVNNSNIELNFDKNIDELVNKTRGAKILKGYGSIIVECSPLGNDMYIPKTFNEKIFNRLLTHHEFSDLEKVVNDLSLIETQHLDLLMAAKKTLLKRETTVSNSAFYLEFIENSIKIAELEKVVK